MASDAQPSTAAFDWSRRAPGPELMDQPCSYQEFRDCLHDLEQVNRLTFAYRPTLQWLQSVAPSPQPLHIVDVGCGGGDMLRRIYVWALRQRLSVTLTGIDLNPYAAQAARELTPPGIPIRWVTGDAFSYAPPEGIDVVLSSLFTHHLENDEIIAFLQWMHKVARVGWFINDLHREPKPFQAFRLLSRVMRWHRFVQHDGPLSIRRSFQPTDWRTLIKDAGLNSERITIQPRWPARLCVGCLK